MTGKEKAKQVVSILGGLGAATFVSRVAKATKPEKYSIVAEVGLLIFEAAAFLKVDAFVAATFDAVDRSARLVKMKLKEKEAEAEELEEDGTE